MKLSTCPKGHFYDADKYASCPYCVPQDEAEAVTEALNVTMEDFSTRAPSTGAPADGAVFILFRFFTTTHCRVDKSCSSLFRSRNCR